MVTDPIGDFIVRLKNAGAVGKETVSVPYSKLKHAVAEKLRERGYVASVAKRGRKAKKFLDVELVYGASRVHKITGVRRLSKPGRRLYASVRELRPVKFGKGVLILSTPKGILTGEEARKSRVGGETLFEIW